MIVSILVLYSKTRPTVLTEDQAQNSMIPRPTTIRVFSALLNAIRLSVLFTILLRCYSIMISGLCFSAGRKLLISCLVLNLI